MPFAEEGDYMLSCTSMFYLNMSQFLPHLLLLFFVRLAPNFQNARRHSTDVKKQMNK